MRRGQLRLRRARCNGASLEREQTGDAGLLERAMDHPAAGNQRELVSAPLHRRQRNAITATPTGSMYASSRRSSVIAGDLFLAQALDLCFQRVRRAAVQLAGEDQRVLARDARWPARSRLRRMRSCDSSLLGASFAGLGLRRRPCRPRVRLDTCGHRHFMAFHPNTAPSKGLVLTSKARIGRSTPGEAGREELAGALRNQYEAGREPRPEERRRRRIARGPASSSSPASERNAEGATPRSRRPRPLRRRRWARGPGAGLTGALPTAEPPMTAAWRQPAVDRRRHASRRRVRSRRWMCRGSAFRPASRGAVVGRAAAERRQLATQRAGSLGRGHPATRSAVSADRRRRGRLRSRRCRPSGRRRR